MFFLFRPVETGTYFHAGMKFFIEKCSKASTGHGSVGIGGCQAEILQSFRSILFLS